jgi:hypothetical protein
LRWRTARAARTAAALDRLVDTQLPLLPGLGEDARAHAAEYLAELVELAGWYRQYAGGRIGRRELDRLARQALARLGARERRGASRAGTSG